MSKLSCIIVEDEPLAAKLLSGYIAEVPFLQLEAVLKDAILATDFLREHHVDLIFLDIHLPKMKGMAFLKTLLKPPAVIVTTAYHQYAIEGYSMNVADYLLKPFSFERFLSAVMKVKNAQVPREDQKKYLFLNVQKKKVKVLFSDIVYIESQKEYIRIVTTKGEFLTKMSTNEIEQLLPGEEFRRVHRSFIVSVARIDSYTSETVEVNGISLPIGRGYRDAMDNL